MLNTFALITNYGATVEKREKMQDVSFPKLYLDRCEIVSTERK